MRLIERVWFYRHPAKYLLVPLLLPLSLLFWLLSSLRKALFLLGIKASVKLSCPVVIVGNIGVGGNGKTPLVLFLVEQLTKQGIKVGVISRGYGGQAPYYPYLLDSKTSAEQAGDEPVLIYQRTKVPVVVASDRVAAAKQLIELGCQLIMSDDGMQHYRLQRDYELLVVDGKRQFGNGLLLPAGPLRESCNRLNSVNRIIINGEQPLSYPNKTAQHHMLLTAERLINVKTGEQLVLADFIQQFPQVNAMAGIGDPARFFNYLVELGFILDKSQGFIDHQAYNKSMLTALAQQNEILLMTEKDAVKCTEFAQKNWWYLPVDASFSASDKRTILTDIVRLIA
ncbi:tetraacyldisaccharide 4'-kinase [Thalassotalea insulae]|uniref:Tetraacyldisaccharide 4'-kinase n=1 Tax=Thalassotalea insulae TaxID=2056778 RepID=A0ABQ6GV42_9GAMM|nr:tetraacyldisaccharide 4'-kinase [Thalassotalea insulae]GLX79808.1 tetraacyldisaccharide 4'-kinase [Thalassotalea insulae]